MSKVQSVLINKIVGIDDAIDIVSRNGWKTSFYGKGPDVTDNFYRFRQLSPKMFTYYRVKNINPYIKLVIGYN